MERGDDDASREVPLPGAARLPHPFHPGRFYSLDVLRGLGAISVVFWHWAHFFFVGDTYVKFPIESQPLYGLFAPLYVGGWRAVSLFFSLSGFIFYWLYAERIATRKTGWREFAVLRFSRLYPLHLATLLFVAGGQWLFWQRFGTFCVYPDNDAYHFILQLFFVSSWWQPGFVTTFNGPVWSVSVEVLLYLLFFLFCVVRFHRWWHLVLLIVLGDWLEHLGWPQVGSGLVSFFIGGLTYKAYTALTRRGYTWRSVAGLSVLLLVLWVTVPVNSHYHLLWRAYEQKPFPANIATQPMDPVGSLLLLFTEKSYELTVFPLMILVLAMAETLRGGLGRRVAFLGDISYSTYLLHFPLQLAFKYTVLSLAISTSIFYSPWMLAAFFAVLLPLAWTSYHFLERPAQSYLRKQLLPPR